MPESHSRSGSHDPGDSDPPIRDGAQLIRSDGLPPTLRWAVWILAAEAAGLVAVLVFLVAASVEREAVNVAGAVMVIVFTLLMIAALGGLSWALLHRHGWARGPAIVLQLLLLPIAYTMITTGLPVVGVPVLLVGAAGAGTLLAPATRAALIGR